MLNVDRVLGSALRQGTQLRARRRIGYAGAGLAVAAIASLGAVTPGSHSGSTVTGAVPAASGPTSATPAAGGLAPTTLQAGQVLHLGHRVIATVVSCTRGEPDAMGGNPGRLLKGGQYVEVESSTVSGEGTGFAVVLTGPTKAISALWSNGFHSSVLGRYDRGLTIALPADSPLVRPVYQGQAVAVHLPGWKQVGKVADDKQSLAGPGGAVADIVWRPASERAAWVTDSDQGANASTWTSPVHDGVFVTIHGGQGTSSAEVQALGDSLTWN